MNLSSPTPERRRQHCRSNAGASPDNSPGDPGAILAERFFVPRV